MRAGNVSKGIHHGQHDQAEGKRNPNMGDTSTGDFVDNDCPGSCENQREGSESTQQRASSPSRSTLPPLAGRPRRTTAQFSPGFRRE